MKVDFNTVITDKNGKALKDDYAARNGADPVPDLTLGAALQHALFLPTDEKVNDQEKLKRGLLGLKIEDDPIGLDLSPEWITTLKTLVAKIYAPLVVARVWLLLDDTLKETKA